MTIVELNKSVWKISPSGELNWISERYPNIPPELREFLCSFRKVESFDGKSWFFSAVDFVASNENGFSFDEFEKISLTAADNKAWQNQIIEFWNNHVPVYASVRNGYEYIAYNISLSQFFAGREPEFEVTTVIAKSFEEFILYVNNIHTYQDV